MRLLRSDYVAGRYREELNKLSLNPTERSAIIIALYATHVGENAPVSFLSDAMGMDYGSIIDNLNVRAGNDAFHIVRRAGAIIESVPSIGAENILKNLFSDSEIVDAIVPVLKNLAATRRSPFAQRMFSQMMRFSILSTVVSSKDEIDRFFENNKQQSQIRLMPLFWLQWHMAKCSAGELSVAEKFLEQGYIEAAKFERSTGKKFDRRQLDDQRAKFLMLRAEKIGRAAESLVKEFNESIVLAEKILRQNEPQHYPFETLAAIVRTFGATSHKLDPKNRNAIHKRLDDLLAYAHQRVGVIPHGYQRERAQSALNNAELRK